MDEMPGVCCERWWQRLSIKEREYIHYYFFDIEHRGALEGVDVHRMHEFRFTTEGHPR